MAIFQKESGTCTGRGFADVDASGYLAKFKTWVVKDPPSGGPGWYILRDRSINPTQFTYTIPNPADGTVICPGHYFVTGDQIRVSSTGTLPYASGGGPGGGQLNSSSDYMVYVIDATALKFTTNYNYAYAGAVTANCYVYSSGGTGTQRVNLNGPYIIVSDSSSPAINDSTSKIIKTWAKTSEAGYARVSHFLGWDGTKPYGLWSDHALSTVDSGDFVYDFRGGSEIMILQSRNPNLSGNQWTTSLIDNWVGDSNLVEGTDKTGTLIANATSGSDATLRLSPGDASNFTLNNYYFIYNMAGTGSWVNYSKVKAFDGSNIVVNNISRNFPAGSKIGAYPHRFYTGGSNGLRRFPYVSEALNQAYVVSDQNYSSIMPDGYGPFFSASYDSGYLEQMNPNDYGQYAVQRPNMRETHMANTPWYTQESMNRAYGVVKNVYVATKNTMSQALDGRVINGKNYLYFQSADYVFGVSDSARITLFQDTTSLS